MAYSANILHADQHQDSSENLFLMRVEWDLSGFYLPMENFIPPRFSRIATKPDDPAGHPVQ